MKKFFLILCGFLVFNLLQSQVVPTTGRAVNITATKTLTIGSKLVNRISDDSTLASKSGNSLITEGAVKRYIDNSKGEGVNVKFFGAISDAFEATCSTNGSTTVTVSGFTLNSSHLNKKMQIYKGGTSNYSKQVTIIQILSSTSCRVNQSVAPTLTNVPCIIGSNSKASILAAIDFAKNNKINTVNIDGNYLIGGNDGDMVTGHFLGLKYSDFTYDFKGSKIYGNVILWDENGYPQVNNCKVVNVTVYSLGDGVNATTSNTNWNGVGVAEGSNNTFENITVFANGGTRGFSAQSEKVSGGITNTLITNFRFTGLYDYEKTDGFDISAINDSTINGLKINNVFITNCGRGFYANSITSNNFFYDIHVTGVTVINASVSPFRAFKVKNSSFNNFTLQKTGTSTDAAIEIGNLVSTVIMDLTLENKASQTAHLFSTSDCNNSFLKNIRLVNTNATKCANGLLLLSPNLVVDGVYIENTTTGLYKAGVVSTVKNYSYKSITNPVRDNTADANLRLENVIEVFNSSVSNVSDLSGFQAVAYCVFDGTGSGTLTPTKSKNILSVVKNSTGLYTITFKYTLKELPVLAGSCRYYGSIKIPFISTSPTTTSIVVRVEDAAGNLGDSDYISLVFF